MQSLKSLKEVAATHGIVPVGDKRLAQTWKDAIESYYLLQSQAVELATEAEVTATGASESIEVAVVSVGSLVVAALTSDDAISVYRGILKGLVLVVVLAFMLTSAAAKWLWAHKHEAAVYCWISDWMESQSGRSVLTHALIVEWVAGEWVDTLRGKWDAIVSSLRGSTARSLSRVGLSGAAIEVQ